VFLREVSVFKRGKRFKERLRCLRVIEVFKRDGGGCMCVCICVRLHLCAFAFVCVCICLRLHLCALVSFFSVCV
jgi:hypothetical protein